MTSKSQQMAIEILNRAMTKQCRVDVRGSILTVSKSFTPGDLDAYVNIEGDCYGILDMLHTTSAGSVWGSTSDGVGGHVAVTDGYYVINKSGGDKRVLSALAKMI
jgi:hypothetical protein